jgi:ketosteroid isomerase-like protein
MNSAATQARNKAIVKASFDRWERGTGDPFELLVPECKWTIAGSSPMSRTYNSRQEFLTEVSAPLHARMKQPPARKVRGIYADDDKVIVLFDMEAEGRDGSCYRNSYAWFFTMRDEAVSEVVAFFDTRAFDEFWTRVSPKL